MSTDFEILKVLIDASNHVQSVYINNVWATMGSYLVAFGWLLTSTQARDYLIGHPKLLRNSIYVSEAIFVVHASVLISMYLDSVSLIQQMELLRINIDKDQLEGLISIYDIPIYWPIVSLIINGSIVALLVQKLRGLQSNASA